MLLKISTEEENFKTIITDLRRCGHTGLADSIEQALNSYKKMANTANTAATNSSASSVSSKQSSSEQNPWEL